MQILSEYDHETPQTHTKDQPTAPEHYQSQDIRKTIKAAYSVTMNIFRKFLFSF